MDFKNIKNCIFLILRYITITNIRGRIYGFQIMYRFFGVLLFFQEVFLICLLALFLFNISLYIYQTSFLLQVTANVLAFLCMNIVGIFVHNLMERAQRKAFLDTRNCIKARLEMEDENEKLVSEILLFISSIYFFRKRRIYRGKCVNTNSISMAQLLNIMG